MTASVTRLSDRRAGAKPPPAGPPRILGCVQWVRSSAEQGGPRATGRPKALLLYLSSYADADGTNLRVGTARIVQELGWPLATVKRARRKLIELGDLIVLVEGTGSKSTEYRIPVPNPPEKSVGTRSGRGVIVTPGGGHSDPGGGVIVTPNRPGDRPNTGEAARGDRCDRHQADDEPPPCRSCGRARVAHEERLRADALAAAAAAREARQEADRQAATTSRARRLDDPAALVDLAAQLRAEIRPLGERPLAETQPDRVQSHQTQREDQQ